MIDSDYQMALQLQQQFEHEANVENPKHNLVYTSKKGKQARDTTKSLTDPSWELIDPTPNIHLLFLLFNDRYFWGKLLAVCVDWSKRMTSCAGICSYQGPQGMCRITLSEPLLKLRPRKDLIETLLHEMIHAYLFITNNYRDRSGHGPEFHKHMFRINNEAGTNITVYHSFHDEVMLYQQHWWRCDGPCQEKKPYFGMVRRATSRAPGKNDSWWAEHQESCGGKFVKVKEPEKASTKKTQKENKPVVVKPETDIRNFFPTVTNTPSATTSAKSVINKPIPINSGVAGSSNIVGFKDLNKRPKNALANSSNTIVINKKSSQTEPPEQPKSNLVEQPKSTVVDAFSGTGQTMTTLVPIYSDDSNYVAVRNHWANKFPGSSVPQKKRLWSLDDQAENEEKRFKIQIILPARKYVFVTCPICEKEIPDNELNAHLDYCLDQPQWSNRPPRKRCPVCEQEVDTAIIHEHIDACLDKSANNSESTSEELIACLVCSKQVPKDGLNEHLDDCMSDNIFNGSSDDCVTEITDEAETKDEGERKYNCPVCFELFLIGEMNAHVDKCLTNDCEKSGGNSVLDAFFNEPF